MLPLSTRRSRSGPGRPAAAGHAHLGGVAREELLLLGPRGLRRHGAPESLQLALDQGGLPADHNLCHMYFAHNCFRAMLAGFLRLKLLMVRWRLPATARFVLSLVLLPCMRVHGAQPPLRSLRTGGSTASGAANGNIRRAVLCTLAVQNACQMLSMRYSRMPGQPKYLTSTAVVTAEATKIAAAFLIMLYQHRGRAFAEVWQGVIVDWRDTMLVGVPAFLYLIQNNLLYVATTHLDAATCQVRHAAAPCPQPDGVRA